MIDLLHYCWREHTTDADGNERMLIPWSDPNRYEFPADGIFETTGAALAYKESLGAEDEPWVLVRFNGIIIPNP